MIVNIFFYFKYFLAYFIVIYIILCIYHMIHHHKLVIFHFIPLSLLVFAHRVNPQSLLTVFVVNLIAISNIR